MAVQNVCYEENNNGDEKNEKNYRQVAYTLNQDVQIAYNNFFEK